MEKPSVPLVQAAFVWGGIVRLYIEVKTALYTPQKVSEKN